MREEAGAILRQMDGLNIRYELYRHEALEHALDRERLGLTFGASACKNLFLTTRSQSSFYVLTLPAAANADLRAVARMLGSSRLCFGSDEMLALLLRQSPGMVGPLGGLFDGGHRVTFLIDAALRGGTVALHPGDNQYTVVLDALELERYLRALGCAVVYVKTQ